MKHILLYFGLFISYSFLPFTFPVFYFPSSIFFLCLSLHILSFLFILLSLSLSLSYPSDFPCLSSAFSFSFCLFVCLSSSIFYLSSIIFPLILSLCFCVYFIIIIIIIIIHLSFFSVFATFQFLVCLFCLFFYIFLSLFFPTLFFFLLSLIILF